MSEKRELRVIKGSDDGDWLELHDLDGEAFLLRITDHLKALANKGRLVSVSQQADNALDSISIKEIQLRLRSGEDMESICLSGNVSIEKVERYSTPILQERSYIISLAQKAIIKKEGYPLIEIIESKLAPRGVDMKSTSWNSFRNDDGSWHVAIEYLTQDGSAKASWNFDPVKKNFVSIDDGARWILGEELTQRARSPRPSQSEFGPRQMVDRAIEENAPPRLVAVKNESRDDVAEVEELDFQSEATVLGLELEKDFDSDISHEAKKDGVTKRVSIPSWDDIMFGTTERGSNEPRND